VDDNRDHVESLAMLMVLLGHDVRVAHDGLEALGMAAAFVPEVALIDIGLPGLNGHEVARRIREQPALRRALLIAQTGWGEPEDFRRSREAGFDHHLMKPAELSTLLELIGSAGTTPED